MTKRISKQLNSFKYKGESVRLTLGTLIITGFCVLMIIVATFTQVTVTHPYFPADTFVFLAQDVSDYDIMSHFITSYKYIPQIPVIFFIVSLLGRKFAMLAVFAYIVLGLFFPIFALGGGISYLFEYGFGYILAFLPAIFFAGTLLKDRTDFLRIFLISVLGVIIIHVLGTLYMLFIATLRHAQMDMVLSWISSQSGVQVLYDIFFSILGIYLGKQARKFLWIIMC